MKLVTLTMPQSFALIQLILAEYSQSGMNDIQFAEYAAIKLQLPINDNHVATRRREFDISSNVVKLAAPVHTDLASRIEAIEVTLKEVWLTLQYLQTRSS